MRVLCEEQDQLRVKSRYLSVIVARANEWCWNIEWMIGETGKPII